MDPGSQQEMNGATSRMNGHHATNGVSQNKSPTKQANGDGSDKKATSAAQPVKALNDPPTDTNGVQLSAQNALSAAHTTVKMDQLPEEIQVMLRRIPDDAYVPMDRLVIRAAKTCWSDLVQVLNTLKSSDQGLRLHDLPADHPESMLVNERHRKQMLWNFAEEHKRAMIKISILLQWSAKSEDNKVTIGLNFYLHEIRRSFMAVNESLTRWIDYSVHRQDAAPDLDTAMKILATGRIEGLPNLGYVEQKDLSSKELLATLRRLNKLLEVRMIAEESIPVPMSDWHIHDGRCTFSVPEEFDLDVSVISEDADACFQLVDVRFNFWPAPNVVPYLLDEVTRIVNHQLATKGLPGAYHFLHELTLTQKLTELHSQALTLARGLWAGHLHTEMHKRTLVVQYWTRRASSKSWIEVTINSARSSHAEFATSFLKLRWMRHGKLVTDHDVELDLVHLSIESILSQVIAQHINGIFDGIYDKLSTTQLHSEGGLELEQSSSSVDAFGCSLTVQISKMERIHLTCDPVGGTIVLSPPGDRVSRLQHELTKAPNPVEEFAKRFPAFRCALAQTIVSKAIQNTSWQTLVGRKPSLPEVRDLFGQSTLRAVFYRQPGWTQEWMLAATFGHEGDLWWLVFEPAQGRPLVQKVDLGPVHLQRSLTCDYFESMSRSAAATITLQVGQQAIAKKGLRTILSATDKDAAGMKVGLSETQNLHSIHPDIVLVPHRSKRTSARYYLNVLARLNASKEVLETAASAGLDSSVQIYPDKQSLRLRLQCAVGESKIDVVLVRLQYVNDIISCIRLVHRSSILKLAQFSLQSITIDYSVFRSTPLSLRLLFEPAPDGRRIQMLPEDRNSHDLVAEYLDKQLEDAAVPLSQRLEKVLAHLQWTLPMLNTLQFFQGRIDPEEIPEMTTINLEESKKWLRTHVLVRDSLKYGLHFSAVSSAFRKDVNNQETPANMLVRLEIEPQVSGGASRLGWVVRAAIEEFKSYIRPSFTSQDLKRRLKDRIARKGDAVGWLSMDSAAECMWNNPYQLLAALQTTVLDWVKEEAAAPQDFVPRQHPPQPPANPQNNGNPSRPSGQPSGRTQAPQSRQNVQQGRPQQVQQNTTRQMSAAPQEVRQTPNQQRRTGHGNQNRGSQRGTPGFNTNGQDVINLD